MTCKALRLKELFPEARDWIDAGRMMHRRQIEEHIERVNAQADARCRLAFPMGTASAMAIVCDLGFDATRGHFDYFIRHSRMQLPPKNGRLLSWGIENVIDFAMQLQRMRYWRHGRHDQRKTFWELQNEYGPHNMICTIPDGTEVQDMDADQALDVMIDAGSVQCRAATADALAEELEAADAFAEILLDRIMEEPSPSALEPAVGKHVTDMRKTVATKDTPACAGVRMKGGSTR